MSNEAANTPERNELPSRIEIKDFKDFDRYLGVVCAGIYAQEYLTTYNDAHPDGPPSGGANKESVAWVGDQLREMCAYTIQALPDDLHIDKARLYDLASLANPDYPPPQYLQNITPLIGCVALLKVYAYLRDLIPDRPDNGEEAEQFDMSPTEALKYGAGVMAIELMQEYDLADMDIEAAADAFGAKTLEIFRSDE
jgi:hypothetical protein